MPCNLVFPLSNSNRSKGPNVVGGPGNFSSDFVRSWCTPPAKLRTPRKKRCQWWCRRHLQWFLLQHRLEVCCQPGRIACSVINSQICFQLLVNDIELDGCFLAGCRPQPLMQRRWLSPCRTWEGLLVDFQLFDFKSQANQESPEVRPPSAGGRPGVAFALAACRRTALNAQRLRGSIPQACTYVEPLTRIVENYGRVRG